MKRAFAVLAVVGAVGCTSNSKPEPPSITIDPAAACAGGIDTCLNAGATTHDVSGVNVIHKRVEGDPVVAIEVFIDGGDRGGMQLWSEDLALDMLSSAGPTDLGLVGWRAAKTSIGASITASMGTDHGVVSAVAPVTYWDHAWDLLSRALTNPSIDDYLLSYISGVIQHGYDTELDDPETAAPIAASSALFAGTLRNRFRETRADVGAVTVDDAAEAWAGMLTKERVWIVVVGDVAWPDVAGAVSQSFGAISSRHVSGFPPPPPPRSPPTSDQATVLDYPDAPNWQIIGYFFGPPPTDPDYAPLSVAMKLLDQRLFREVRDARGLAYSVGASLGLDRPSLGALSLATNAPQDALPVVREVISDLVSTPVSDDELAGARALLESALVFDNRTPSDMAHTLGEYQLIMGDRLGVDAYATALATVTPESARNALDRYLRAVSLAAAGPGGTVDRTSLLGILPHGASDGGMGDASDGGFRDAAEGGIGNARDAGRGPASDGGRADAGDGGLGDRDR